MLSCPQQLLKWVLFNQNLIMPSLYIQNVLASPHLHHAHHATTAHQNLIGTKTYIKKKKKIPDTAAIRSTLPSPPLDQRFLHR